MPDCGELDAPGLVDPTSVPNRRNARTVGRAIIVRRPAANHRPYLPRSASFNPPTAFCTLPAALSALPSVSSFLSPRTLPAASFTAPLTCSAEPLIRSLSMSYAPCLLDTSAMQVGGKARSPCVGDSIAASVRPSANRSLYKINHSQTTRRSYARPAAGRRGSADRGPQQRNNGRGHQRRAGPAEKSQRRPGAETTHHRQARNDHHHDRHDRNGDNAIEHGAPNQHSDGIDLRIAERESHHRGAGNDAVNPDGIRRFRLQGGGPAERLRNAIRRRAGKRNVPWSRSLLSPASESC